jgi:hypothetical protein
MGLDGHTEFPRAGIRPTSHCLSWDWDGLGKMDFYWLLMISFCTKVNTASATPNMARRTLHFFLLVALEWTNTKSIFVYTNPRLNDSKVN